MRIEFRANLNGMTKSQLDEEGFLNYLKQIPCVTNVIKTNVVVYWYIERDAEDRDILHDDDLYELLVFYDRYRLDMKDLRRYLNDANKEWLYDHKKAFWHKRMFGKEKI